MGAQQPTPEYRAWVDHMVARLVPRAAELRADPSRGAQNSAAALESILRDLQARAAGIMPTAPVPHQSAPITRQADLFL